MAARCPACGLLNPASAVMCDCGQLLRHDVSVDTMAQADRATREVRARRSIPRTIGALTGVIIAILALRFLVKLLIITH